ncbi:hypothetical protein BHE74_00024482 [Ensete ventricosum]|uniref:Uncharacterized protein n=1 Tax=Ensete ventricosum TaxID=4639 RepID=A0A444C8R8_ENSVE|nr:hypothetical protein GW17_00056256 [Ensete ventricosum]RWW68026.1 hypothetical protein BHE74_00024482 [Ensete ventricosum]RZR72152.1 hypothetical protein BHM03_00010862 [Ensete ventricosum]
MPIGGASMGATPKGNCPYGRLPLLVTLVALVGGLAVGGHPCRHPLPLVVAPTYGLAACGRPRKKAGRGRQPLQLALATCDHPYMGHGRNRCPCR